MTEDEDVSWSEEEFLEEGYMRALTARLFGFAKGLGFSSAEARANIDGVSRLFVRFDSFPSRARWIAAHSEHQVNGSASAAAAMSSGTPEERGRAAFAAWKEKKLERAAYDNIAAALLKSGNPDAVFKGRDGRLLIGKSATEADFVEAFR